jgi:hypothetical protein
MTRCAKVARRKGRSYERPSVKQWRKDQTRNKFTRYGRSGRDVGWIRKAALVWRIQAQDTITREFIQPSTQPIFFTCIFI